MPRSPATGKPGRGPTKGGFDLIAQGLSGIMSVTGHARTSEPVKVGVPLTDLGAGLFAVDRHSRRSASSHASGRGQHIDTSLVDAGLALSVWEVTDYFTTGKVPGPLGSAHRLTAPYQAFKCADGHITIGAANDRNFAKVAACSAIPNGLAIRDSRPTTSGSQHRDRTRGADRSGDDNGAGARLARAAR